MTTQKTLLLIVGIVVIAGVAVFASSMGGKADPVVSTNDNHDAVVCTMEAKLCPDGTSVGRMGPNCEFAACPSPNATSSILTTSVGGSATGQNITVNPQEIVSDSRCPQDVQCIWAGTVEVRTVISSPVGHEEHVLKLGEPQNLDDFAVTLTDVTPVPKAGKKIEDGAYRFTFEVKKR